MKRLMLSYSFKIVHVKWLKPVMIVELIVIYFRVTQKKMKVGNALKSQCTVLSSYHGNVRMKSSSFRTRSDLFRNKVCFFDFDEIILEATLASLKFQNVA